MADEEDGAAYDRWQAWRHQEILHAMRTGEWLHLGEDDPPIDDDTTSEEDDA